MNLGKIKDRKITLIGGAGFIGHNLALHLQKLGAEVMLCGPKTLMPKFMNEFGVIIENDIKKALKWCDVANVLRIQLERQKVKYFPSLREYSLYFGINKKLLDRINKDIIIMHPGPINRGIEIDSDVADGENSVILDQVSSGIAIRMAIMSLIFKNRKPSK